MSFSELVDGQVEKWDDKDERPVCKVDKNPHRAPRWTSELNTSGAQRSIEVVHIEPDFEGKLKADHLKISSLPMHLRNAKLVLSLVTPSRPRLLQTATMPSARLGGNHWHLATMDELCFLLLFLSHYTLFQH